MNFFTTEKCFKKTVLKYLKPCVFLLFLTQFHKTSSAQIPVRPKLAIQLLLNTNPGPENTADGVVSFFDDKFSFAIGNEDSYKWTNLDENLAIVRNGKLLSIEGRPLVHGSDTMQLKIWTFRQKTYLFKLIGSDFPQTVKAIVRDNYLNKETVLNLSSANLVPFSLTADSGSFAANRFSVIFKTEKGPVLSNAMKFSSIFKGDASIVVAPNPIMGSVINVQLNNVKQGKYEVSLYDADGQLVYAGYLAFDGSTSVQNILLDKRMHKGTYSLLIANGDQILTKNVLFD